MQSLIWAVPLLLALVLLAELHRRNRMGARQPLNRVGKPYPPN